MTNRGVPTARLIPFDKDGETYISELISSGQIQEAYGKRLWELELPTIRLSGKSATEALIDERNSYL